MAIKKRAPKVKPIITGTHFKLPSKGDASKAGMIKLKILAAIIIPALNPIEA